MRNLLYLFNNGYKAFPHLGKGGLGYKPPIKIMGDGLHLMVNDKGESFFIDDMNRATEYFYDQGFIMDDSETGITRNPYDYVDEDGYIHYFNKKGKLKKAAVIEDPTFTETEIDYDSDTIYDDDSEYETSEDEDEIEAESDDVEKTNKAILEYVKNWSEGGTQKRKELTRKFYNIHPFTDDQKKQISNINKNKKTVDQKNELLQEYFKDEKINIGKTLKEKEQELKEKALKAKEANEDDTTQSENFLNTVGYKKIVSAQSKVRAINTKLKQASKLTEADKKYLGKVQAEEKVKAIEEAEAKKLPEFTIPEQEEPVQYEPEIIEEVLNTKLEVISEYKQVVKSLNKLNNIEKAYESIIDPVESQGDDTYGDIFSLGGPIKRKYHGKDFESKLGHNREAMDELLKQALGDNIIVDDIVEPTGSQSHWAKADFTATIQHDEGKNTVISDIDIEFKKINGTTYNSYNTTEKINEKTKLYFDKWYVDFKKELNDANDYAGIDDTDYKKLLESVSTNGKLDKHKMKIKHIESGDYYGLPLSFPKFKTPDKETLLDIMQKKYPTQADQIVKYIRKGQRKNISSNKLVPVYNTKDAILITSLTESLGSLEPFEILNISDNMYSKATPSALSVPACLLKTLKLSGNIIDKSKTIDISHMIQPPDEKKAKAEEEKKENKKKKKKEKEIEI